MTKRRREGRKGRKEEGGGGRGGGGAITRADQVKEAPCMQRWYSQALCGVDHSCLQKAKLCQQLNSTVSP